MPQRKWDPAWPLRQELRARLIPSCWLELRQRVERVHLWGSFPPGPYVAIVGTRAATDEGAGIVHDLAQSMAACGVTIVSGGAEGIDSAAHRGALSAGGRTLVVGPTWWQKPYPLKNRELFQEIVESGGGYVSLESETQGPLNPAFFRRNEALIALSNAVVLGECPLRSGAKNALSHARAMQKARYVVPFSFGHANALGPCQEVNDFGALLIGTAAPILKRLLQSGSFDNPRWWAYSERCKRERLQKQREREDAKKAKEIRRHEAAPKKSRVSASTASTGSAATLLSAERAGMKPQKRRDRQKHRAPAATSVQKSRAQILAAVEEGAPHVDMICDKTGLSAGEVQYQILLLTLEGAVSEDETGLLRYHPPQDAER